MLSSISAANDDFGSWIIGARYLLKLGSIEASEN